MIYSGLKTRRPWGFSLVEVLIAILITAVGILSVTVTLWWGFNASQEGGHMATAANQARVILEAIMGGGLLDTAPLSGGWVSPTSGFNDPELPFEARSMVDDPPFVEKVNIPEDERGLFRRRITSGRLSEDPNDYEYKLAWVKVQVSWKEHGVERSVELYGVVPHNIP